MTLANKQVEFYEEQGFLLVSGLVRSEIAERAHQALLACISNAKSGARLEHVQDPLVLACFGREVCSAAGRLNRSRRSLKPPTIVYAISVPVTAAPWQWPAPHIDHALEADAFKTFPAPFQIGCLIYLNDVRPHTGGTVVWPGSHLQLEALATAHPKKYELLSALNRDIETLTLRSPVEITAAPGDVLFYHRLCAHSGSTNAGTEPRQALNHKW